MIYLVIIDAASFGADGAAKMALSVRKIFNAAEGALWHQEIYRSCRIFAALANGKVFNGAEGSIWRQKIYGS